MKIHSIIIVSLIIILLVFTSCSLSTNPSTQTNNTNKQNTTIIPTIEGEVSDASNYYIVFDGSGSMAESAYSGSYGSRIEAAKWAISKFITDVIPNDANLGLYSFDNNGNAERVPLAGNNKTEVLNKIKALKSGGNTPLNSSITKASEILNVQKQKQLGYGYYYIIVITDGQATDDLGGDVKSGVSNALKYQIPIITIGYGIGDTHALAKYSIAYRSATDPNSLFQALKETHGESEYFDATTFNK